MAAPFSGFPKDFFRFFDELAAHNEKPWFEANKQRYRDVVVGSSSAFIEAMAPRLAKISKHVIADPRPNGGSMFRIYRDVRFSKDKRPYKDHAGIHFRHRDGKTAHAPGYYVHLSPSEVFFGGGVWMAEPDALQKIRRAIATKSAAWNRAVGSPQFTKLFGEVQGEALQRPPKGFEADHPLIDMITKKSFFAMQQASVKQAQAKDFAERAEAAFVACRPLLKFLCDAVDAPF